jgi:hypothetical protein
MVLVPKPPLLLVVAVVVEGAFFFLLVVFLANKMVLLGILDVVAEIKVSSMDLVVELIDDVNEADDRAKLSASLQQLANTRVRNSKRLQVLIIFWMDFCS